jgi:hypothetical protein
MKTMLTFYELPLGENFTVNVSLSGSEIYPKDTKSLDARILTLRTVVKAAIHDLEPHLTDENILECAEIIFQKLVQVFNNKFSSNMLSVESVIVEDEDNAVEVER